MAFETRNSSNSMVERLRITSDGKIGIGNNNPSYPLVLTYTNNTTYSSSNFIANGLLIENTSTTDNTASGIFFTAKGSGANAGAAHINCIRTANGSGSLAFSTRHNVGSHTERVRITSNGRLHIRPSNTFYAMNPQSSDLVIGDGGGGRGITFWTASAADNQTISFQTNESLSRAEGEISYGPTGTNTVADRNAMMFRTNSAERFRIDSSGRVSIASGAYGGGGTSPELYVRGTSGRQVKIHNTNAATCSLQLTNSTSGEGEDHGMQFALLGGGGGYFKHHVNNANVLDMYSQVSGSGKYIMKIYNDGKIGQQSNSDCLMLSTSQNGSGNQYFLRGSKNSTQPGGGNDVVWIYEDGDVYNNNNTYGQQSDIKLKENIVNASSQWDDIKNLKVRNFNFKESTGLDTHTQIGLVAQEAELVSPGLIKVVKDRKKTEEKNELGSISYKESLSETETTKYVKYSVLHMKAIKCLQEAQARIETLEQENIALRVRVTNLEDN